MRKISVVVLLFLNSLVLYSPAHAQTSRYWSDIDLASIEGILVFPEDGPSFDLNLLDNELPRVTTSASIVISDGAAAVSWRPVEVEPFKLSHFEIDISLANADLEGEVQAIELPVIAGNRWGPGTAMLPFPALEATGEFRNESFAVEFRPTDFVLGIEEVSLGNGTLVASFTQESQFDSGTAVQELLPPEMHETPFPGADLIVNHWFTVEDLEEIPFDYSEVRFFETPIGDANNDGIVDQNDFFIVSFNFGLAGETTWEQGDFDANGIVEFKDFLGLALNFDGAVQAAAVPEPSTNYLLFSVLAFLSLSRLMPTLRREV